jgi:energy-converting hydrogenase Eha subunit H
MAVLGRLVGGDVYTFFIWVDSTGIDKVGFYSRVEANIMSFAAFIWLTIALEGRRVNFA